MIIGNFLFYLFKKHCEAPQTNNVADVWWGTPVIPAVRKVSSSPSLDTDSEAKRRVDCGGRRGLYSRQAEPLTSAPAAKL